LLSSGFLNHVISLGIPFLKTQNPGHKINLGYRNARERDGGDNIFKPSCNKNRTVY
jgi:hypothetical protein